MNKKLIVNIHFYSIDELIRIYSTGTFGDYSNIGVKLLSNQCLSQIMYSKKEYSPNKATITYENGNYHYNRRVIIDYFVLEVIIELNSLGKSLATITKLLSQMLKIIEKLDSDNIDFLKNIANAKYAYQHYVNYLKEAVKKPNGGYQNSYAGRLQSSAKQLLEGIHQDLDGFISHGIKAIKDKKELRKPRKTNTVEDISYAFNFYTKFFIQITDFLLENKTYPFEVHLEKKKFWIVPSKNFWIKKVNNTRHLVAFDYDNGKIRSCDSVHKIYAQKKREDACLAVKRLIKVLKRNNLHFKTDEKLQLASFAMKAYFMHFLIITGMNDSTAAKLKWDNDYLVSKDSQYFRNIKDRAGNKDVEFSIQKDMMSYFNKFIKLRNYLLGEHNLDFIFFEGNHFNAHLPKKQIEGGYSSSIYKIFQPIDHNLPSILSKQSRLNKANYIINKNSIITASNLMQSSIAIITKSYTNQSEEVQIEEMEDFYSNLNKYNIFKDDSIKEISTGQCADTDTKTPEELSTTLSIDCKQPEGCIFCQFYRVHPDNIDVRKLYSLLFVINQCRYIVKSEKDFLNVYSHIIKRIEDIIDQIINTKLITEDKIKEIKVDVFEHENLTEYWEHKLICLVEMGVLR
jgi:hypothetical protein